MNRFLYDQPFSFKSRPDTIIKNNYKLYLYHVDFIPN